MEIFRFTISCSISSTDCHQPEFDCLATGQRDCPSSNFLSRPTCGWSGCRFLHCNNHYPLWCCILRGILLSSILWQFQVQFLPHIKLSDTLLLFSSIHQYLLISILTFISNKEQSFQSNRSLISGVLLTTGTIQYYKRSKTQKVKVATFTQK